MAGGVGVLAAGAAALAGAAGLAALALEGLGGAVAGTLGALAEQAAAGEPLCFACAMKAGAVAGALTALTFGLSRLPCVRGLAGKLASALGESRVGQWAARTLERFSPSLRRAAAARHIRQARSILTRTRPELTPTQRNQIIRAFPLETFRVRTLTAELQGFRYYDGTNARLGGAWSTPQWLDAPTERISQLALPNNEATLAARVRLLPGSTIFEGEVAPQPDFGAHLVGGGSQWYAAERPRAVIEPMEPGGP